MSDTSKQWTTDQANAWYDAQPWPCGFNYIPANAISYTEMWMPYCFDAKFIDCELALAESIGFNCLRFVLPFVVWEEDPAAFNHRLDEFLGICSRRGLRAMPCLFDDCAFGDDVMLQNPTYGQQPGVREGWYANGWTASPGHDMVRNLKTWLRLEHYVKDLIATFKDDARVWVWDLYNEPTNGGVGDASLPLVERVYAWARDVGPTQPLTIAQWSNQDPLNELIIAQSDVITFHDYGNAQKLAGQIERLKTHGRPIINTEWLCRHRGSTVQACLPVFHEHRIGCLHWGLVNGRTQTHLHWGWRPGRGEPDIWQHDLYHGDHRPYDQRELDLFAHHIGALRVD